MQLVQANRQQMLALPKPPAADKKHKGEGSAGELDVRELSACLLQSLLQLHHTLACFDSRGAGHSPQQCFEAWLLALWGNGFKHDIDFNKLQCRLVVQ